MQIPSLLKVQRPAIEEKERTDAPVGPVPRPAPLPRMYAQRDRSTQGDHRSESRPSPAGASTAGSAGHRARRSADDGHGTEAPSAPASSASVDAFSSSLKRDSDGADTLTLQGRDLAASVLSPNQRDAPKVQVSTFAVDGIQANDMMVVQRIKPDKDGTNTLLYMPERSGPSFREFKNTDAMNSWLRDTAADPRRLARFSRHFSDGAFPKRTEHVQEKMRQFQQGDGNAVVGAFGQESDDIFARLNRKSTAPPVPVNGLSDLQFSYEAPEGGHATYNGRRPDGETVHYQYDPYGNFIGEAGNQKEFYFQKNGLNSFEPLSPLTKGQFDKEIKHAVENNVARADTGGLFDSLIKTLKNPAHERMSSAPMTAEETQHFESYANYTAYLARRENRLGAYDRVNDMKYPIRNFYDQPMYATRIDAAGASHSGASYKSDLLEPYLGVKDKSLTPAKLRENVEEKLQYRKFTEADMKGEGERALVGQGMVVANRRIAKGEALGVYGGRLIPPEKMVPKDPFILDARALGAPAHKWFSGDNLISRMNTNFEFDSKGVPIRQARGGYNVETATFQAMVKSPHAGQPESKLSVTGFFATEDIPAGTELRWNYRYDDASMKLLFGGRGPASKDVRST